jgi:hypothetical protein
VIGLMVRGKPVSHLLPSQLHQPQEQQQRQLSPKQQQQQGEDAQAGEQQEQAAGLISQQSPGRKNMSWSEVTYVSPS